MDNQRRCDFTRQKLQALEYVGSHSEGTKTKRAASGSLKAQFYLCRLVHESKESFQKALETYRERYPADAMWARVVLAELER
jgi:hypothetical protein